ncbi:hypothetical protein [Campylobacter troglodytis]|uniref:hypothetical protein n=1 Tax=Campylobacter troglodytis TaxID=654363 RepID=UPI00115B3FC8|nr:hypothetical protein [Campylobacter troglodytis]TQR54344.1 hypothetical protein DMC01_10375 [Campylobacter troglodytis]
MDILELANAVFDEIESEVNATSKWKSTSKYARIRHLQIDKRGSFGDRLLRDIFSKERNISLAYRDGDQGEWDIKINEFKIEVKTSSLDVNNKFHPTGCEEVAEAKNEHIKNTPNCDFICFIGVAPDNLFMRLEKISEIDFNKLHNRGQRGTGAGYKWDFKKEQMREICTREEVVALFYEKMKLDKRAIKKNLKEP